MLLVPRYLYISLYMHLPISAAILLRPTDYFNMIPGYLYYTGKVGTDVYQSGPDGT